MKGHTATKFNVLYIYQLALSEDQGKHLAKDGG